MSETGKQFRGRVPEFYDRCLVPIIFEDYASEMADRVVALAPGVLLELATGTGAVTEVLREALPKDCQIIASDLNDPMLELARAKLQDETSISFRVVDAMEIPMQDASVDVIVCQFGVMFFPERVATYREIRRVLRPGGTFLFNVWNGIAENGFANVITDALGTLYPDNPPKFLARTPHGHGCPAEIEADVRAAGFETCVLNQKTDISSAASPDVPAIAYCQGTPLRNEIEALDPGGLEDATDQATQALTRRFGDGRMEGRIRAFVITAK